MSTTDNDDVKIVFHEPNFPRFEFKVLMGKSPP
jgi:hypothetical protein